MRKLLQITLSYLSKQAIKKHDIELIVVTGGFGVNLVKEGVYSILSDRYIVRRNGRDIWWDLSLPLNILGYKDMQRSFPRWIALIFRISFYLVFGPKNKHILVLSAQSEKADTAKYWSDFIYPDTLIVINDYKDSRVTKSLIESTKLHKGRIIHNPEDLTIEGYKKVLHFGKSKDYDISYQEGKGNVTINLKKTKIKIRKDTFLPGSGNIYCAAIAIALVKSMKSEDIIAGVSRIDFNPNILEKIIRKI